MPGAERSLLRLKRLCRGPWGLAVDDDPQRHIHHPARLGAAHYGSGQGPQLLARLPATRGGGPKGRWGVTGIQVRVAPMAASALGFSSEDRSPGSLPV